jgi:uncharacterized Zn-binding protein involved in type VI secretion
MAGVARKGGTDTVSTGHGCTGTTSTLAGSSTVFVDGIGACRKGDTITVHTVPAGKYCIPHSAKINIGSNSVFVDGIGIARNGDSTDAGSLSSGSSSVFAGSVDTSMTTQEGYVMTTEEGFTIIGDL